MYHEAVENAQDFEKCKQSARHFGVPEHMVDALARYIVNRRRPGSFLAAVLSNDLMMALRCADDVNIESLPAYGRFFYNAAPRGCYGSPEAVEAWLASAPA